MPEHGSLFCISPPLLEQVRKVPSTLELFVWGQNHNPDFSSDSEVVEEWKETYPEDYELLGENVYSFIEAGKVSPSYELGTCWWLLHFVFTLATTRDLPFHLVDGSDSTLKVNAICGGKPLKNSRWVANRYLEVEDVYEIAESLSKLSDAVIRQRLQQRLAMEPRVEIGSSGDSWFINMCNDIKAFYNQAAKEYYVVFIRIV